MSVYHHIKQLVAKGFFPTRSDFPGKRQKLVFSCFHRVIKTHQDKIAAYKSVCGRVVKPSGLRTALSPYNRFITGSSLDSARFTHQFFFYNFELEYCLPAFHC